MLNDDKKQSDPGLLMKILLSSFFGLLIVQQFYPNTYAGFLLGVVSVTFGGYLLFSYHPTRLDRYKHPPEALIYLFRAVFGSSAVFFGVGFLFWPLEYPVFLGGLSLMILSTGCFFGALVWLVGYSGDEPIVKKVVGVSFLVLAFSFWVASLFTVVTQFYNQVDWSPMFPAMSTFPNDQSLIYWCIFIGILIVLNVFLNNFIKTEGDSA